MPLITLTIQADTASELKQSIAELAGEAVTQHYPMTVGARGATAEESKAMADAKEKYGANDAKPDLTSQQGQQGGATQEQAKRTRRTKAEMDAARAADPFMAQVKEAAALTEAQEAEVTAADPFATPVGQGQEVITLQMLRDAGNTWMGKEGNSTKGFQDTLKKRFNVISIGQADPKDYPAILAMLQE